VYAIPNPLTAARVAKSGSLTMIRPSTEIRRDFPSRSNGYSNTGARRPAILNAAVADEIIGGAGDAVRIRRRANHGHSHWPHHRTAIMPAAQSLD